MKGRCGVLVVNIECNLCGMAVNTKMKDWEKYFIRVYSGSDGNLLISGNIDIEGADKHVCMTCVYKMKGYEIPVNHMGEPLKQENEE